MNSIGVVAFGFMILVFLIFGLRTHNDPQTVWLIVLFMVLIGVVVGLINLGGF